ALYVLNHKRGHLRDLENSFKVTLAVIADPTVSGQQSFIIDRGEQVHTLEAAKALLAAQVAAFPAYVEEASDDEGPFDIETESEATDAVADFDGNSGEPSLPVVQPESIAPSPERQYADHGEQNQQDAARPSVPEETAQEAERAARRRSTVREKVSFLVETRPDPAPAPVNHSPPQP